ncbi:hypothetical protein VUR80DRAFT_5276 [Thermomyces stellatus]
MHEYTCLHLSSTRSQIQACLFPARAPSKGQPNYSNDTSSSSLPFCRAGLSLALMYSVQPNSVDSATINPAALSSPDLAGSPTRGVKRSRSVDIQEGSLAPDSAVGDGNSNPRKRGKPMKTTTAGAMAEASGQAAAPNIAQTITPQTPQTQTPALPGQTANTFTSPAAAPAPEAEDDSKKRKKEDETPEEKAERKRRKAEKKAKKEAKKAKKEKAEKEEDSD